MGTERVEEARRGRGLRRELAGGGNGEGAPREEGRDWRGGAGSGEEIRGRSGVGGGSLERGAGAAWGRGRRRGGGGGTWRGRAATGPGTVAALAAQPVWPSLSPRSASPPAGHTQTWEGGTKATRWRWSVFVFPFCQASAPCI